MQREKPRGRRGLAKASACHEAKEHRRVQSTRVLGWDSEKIFPQIAFPPRTSEVNGHIGRGGGKSDYIQCGTVKRTRERGQGEQPRWLARRCNRVIRTDVGIRNEKNGLRVHVLHPLFRFRTKHGNFYYIVYSIPHFCAFVKLKYDFNRLKCDFNRFACFFVKKTLREKKPRFHRSARACPSRSFDGIQNARFTVARGPVPRDADVEKTSLQVL